MIQLNLKQTAADGSTILCFGAQSDDIEIGSRWWYRKRGPLRFNGDSTCDWRHLGGGQMDFWHFQTLTASATVLVGTLV
ncbi:MAG: hypothetical protein KGM47_17990, partial [Acidobacteriota bacterium]|nr:hypothetical protein [Acidobacteriota bacterium]